MNMRISTSAYYSQNTNRLLEQQSQIASLQDQISSGVRVEKSSDDPLAFASGQRASNSLTRISQYERNITFGQNQLGEMETAMDASAETMRTIKEKLVQANGGIVSQTDRQILANDLKGKLTELFGYANSKDTSGNYIFSGTSSNIKSFGDGPSFTYQGTPSPNSGISFQVADGRSIDLSINGQDSFVDSTGPGSSGESYFSALQRAITALEDPNVKLGDALPEMMDKMDKIYDNLQIARGKVGDRMTEMDSLSSGFNIITTELQKVVKNETSTDLTQTLSSLSNADTLLQASQKSFGNVSKLSLFDYL